MSSTSESHTDPGPKYLKRAQVTHATGSDAVRRRVEEMLAKINAGGEDEVIRIARDLDGWTGPILVDPDQIAAAARKVPEGLRDDIRFAHDNIRRFAEAQLASAGAFHIELRPGLVAGQRQIPVDCAGCYVPGGRYAHIASAIMTVTTAKVAGTRHVTACSPPSDAGGIHPAVLFAMDLCGADSVLTLGGVQGVAAMAGGLFGLPSADILVGPGNQYVAEAKRSLFGATGIDLPAGPTDSLVVADSSADPEVVAVDLIGQAEHGPNSPVFLVTDDEALARRVMDRAPQLADALPKPNGDHARTAWTDCAEVILCRDREQMAQMADTIAPEHLHVQARDLDWWLDRLRAYGSLFLGPETTVAFGDKCSGPNHVLPTGRAARFTGGLSVHSFLKTVTWQRMDSRAIDAIAGATARISRIEGMEGHARSADIRMRKDV